jgi:predicted MFS family arabinose efflux permease
VVTSTLVFLGLGRGDLISIALAYGSGMGAATTSVFTQIADEVAPERRGSALALGSLAQDIGLAAGAGLAGLAAERSLASVSWLASACSFLALLLLLSRFRLAVGASPAARDAE